MAPSNEPPKAAPSLSNLTCPDGEHLVNLRGPLWQSLPTLNRPHLPCAAAEGRRALDPDFEKGVVLGRPLTAICVAGVKDDSRQFVIGAALEESNWGGLLRSEASPDILARWSSTRTRVSSAPPKRVCRRSCCPSAAGEQDAGPRGVDGALVRAPGQRHSRSPIMRPRRSSDSRWQWPRSGGAQAGRFHQGGNRIPGDAGQARGRWASADFGVHPASGQPPRRPGQGRLEPPGKAEASPRRCCWP